MSSTIKPNVYVYVKTRCNLHLQDTRKTNEHQIYSLLSRDWGIYVADHSSFKRRGTFSQSTTDNAS